MGEKHFEIIMSGRQMALLVAALTGLMLVAFGLGVTVGLLQPRGDRHRGGREEGPTVVGEPELVTTTAPPGWAGVAEEAPPTAVPPTVAPSEPTPLPEPSPSPAVVPSPEPTATPSPTPPPAAPTPLPAREPTPPTVAHPAAGVWVQVGALSQARQGEGLRQRVVALGFAPEQVVVSRGPDGRYRVRLGPFPDEESAGRIIARLRTQGFPDAFMVRE